MDAAAAAACGPVLIPDREKRQESASPPVPIKTYQWEEVRRSRQQGGYPWTHLDKPALDRPEITAEDILRDTEPTMSTRSSGRRTPVDGALDEPQRILNLESSPGSSRKLGEGEPDAESVNIPHFSKEISLESEEDSAGAVASITVPIEQIIPNNLVVNEAKVTLSPKSILKRKRPEIQTTPPTPTPAADDSPRNSKCCHPLVEKLKNIADKTIHHKLQSGGAKRDPSPRKRANLDPTPQEIIDLDNSPGTERRERLKAAKLEDTQKDSLDETILTLDESPRSRKRGEHVYEEMDVDDEHKLAKPASEADEKSTGGSSKDPSLMIDDELMDEDEVAVEENIKKLKTMYDTAMKVPEEKQPEPEPEMEAEEEQEEEEEGEQPVGIVQEVDDSPTEPEKEFLKKTDAPNVTITEVTDEEEVRKEEEEELERKDAKEDIAAEPAPTPEPVNNDDNDDDGGGDFWSKIGDHEYEPVGKPEVATPPESPMPQYEDDASSTTSHERQFLRPPTDEDTHHQRAPDGAHPTASPSLQLQKDIEDRYFVDTPTTPESRTDCEISTSQVDSSALENLPLKKESRKGKTSVGAEASKLRQKISQQTGKLKTKLKTIKKPQFNLPERPKFNMPERPKFNMPERPKINLPERPKFKMPERPKFNMPERPKFLDKAKFSLPERPKFSMPDRSKFKLPERPKLNFAGFGRGKEKSDKSTTETSSTPKKRILDFDFATYPRFSRFRKDKKPSSKAERPGTPPPSFATVPRTLGKDRQAVMGGSHWGDTSNRSGESEPRHYGVPMGYPPSDSDGDFENKLARVDQDYNQMQQERVHNIAKVKLENAEMWNALEMSSVQRMEHRASLPVDYERNDEDIFDDDEASAASTGHHRGVLEEIDKDEFFLRQKGISQDNIEVGKYLSDEIRDAFRSPVNTLHQLDKPVEKAYVAMVDSENNNIPVVFLDTSGAGCVEIEDEDEEEEHHRNMIDQDDGYYTFPPVRPSRSRKQKVMEARARGPSPVADEFEEIDITTESQESQRQQDQLKQENDKNDNLRKSIFHKDADVLQNLNEYENEMEQTRYPTVPKRRKKVNPKDFDYLDDEIILDASYEPEKWMAMKELHDQMRDEEIVVHRMEYVMSAAERELPEESPIPPRRNRSRSRGSRTTSVCDDDRTSRGADSLTLDSHTHLPTNDADFGDDTEEYPGYAVVDKVVARQKGELPPRPPAPVRRHRSTKSLSGDRQFFTVPRAMKEATPPPKRPVRNYSTLGPSRPPRKKSSTSLTDLQPATGTRGSSQYVEIEDDLDDVPRSLQSGDVVRKMKDRPLPPPPRPPRGPRRPKDTKKDDFDQGGGGEGVTMDIDDMIAAERLHTESVTLPPTIDDQLIADEYERDEVIEIEVSTQTDPLPDDFDYTIGMDEPFPVEDQKMDYADEPEENSIDAEILSKGLQHFRESSRPDSRGSRPRTPAERTKSPIIGRMSPTAILLERRVSSPTRINDHREMVTEASLMVIPIDEPAVPVTPLQPDPTFQTRYADILNALPEPFEETLLPEPDPEPVLRQEPLMETQPEPLPEPHPEPQPEPQLEPQPQPPPAETPSISQVTQMIPQQPMDVLRTQKLHVADLEVERLNVAELQASKITVSEIEGLSLQVSDVSSKSGNLVVRGIELGPGILDELLQRFAQMAPPSAPASTQTAAEESHENQEQPPPERPPPPAFDYRQEYSMPPAAFYTAYRDGRPQQDFSEGEPPPQQPPQDGGGEPSRGSTRRRKHHKPRDPTTSSDDDACRPRQRNPQARAGASSSTSPGEPSVAELSSQLFSVCQASMGRTLRYILTYITSHFNSGEQKRDMQMALVIVLVMVAGLILLGVGDGRTVHHHHWDFFNPPNDKM